MKLAHCEETSHRIGFKNISATCALIGEAYGGNGLGGLCSFTATKDLEGKVLQLFIKKEHEATW